MIQRIQSLLLLGVVILLTVNLFVPVWSSSSATNPIVLNAFTISNNFVVPSDTAPQVLKNVYYIGGLAVTSIGLALFIIFQYKKRRLQLMLTNLLVVLCLMVIGSYFIAIPAAKALISETSSGNYLIGYYLPIAASILAVAARYFILKDEALVRSIDRIR